MGDARADARRGHRARRRGAPPRAAWASAPVRATWAVLLAVSPLLVYMTRTARPYALTALLATLALIAFERWYRGEGRRRAWGALYVAATFLGGYLHMTSLAFTLMPFVYFGVPALRRGGEDRRRLFRLGHRDRVAARGRAAAAARQRLVHVHREGRRRFGHGDHARADGPHDRRKRVHTPLVAVVFAAAVVGVVRLWRRDRELAGYLLAVMAAGTLAIVAARPNWIMHPPVLARYVVPILPVFLLFAAEGAVALVAIPIAPVRALAIGLAGGALWCYGPLPAQSWEPNQFTGHLRFQFDYDDAHNPYVQQRPREPLPAFYQELAKAPPSSLKIIVAPWRLESHYNPHAWYQQAHRQRVMIGLTTPLCGVRNFGEYPETEAGMRLANFAHLSAVLRGEDYGADFLVMHLTPWSTPPGADVPWPDVAKCLPMIEAALGAPFYRDERIVVFALGAGATSRGSERPR